MPPVLNCLELKTLFLDPLFDHITRSKAFLRTKSFYLGLGCSDYCQYDIDLISEEEIDEAFNEMKEWYYEWSTIARAIITRKDYLIALDLRKPSKKKPENS